jgi:hypothetical protein
MGTVSTWTWACDRYKALFVIISSTHHWTTKTSKKITLWYRHLAIFSRPWLARCCLLTAVVVSYRKARIQGMHCMHCHLTLYPTRHLIFFWSDLMLKSYQIIWYEFDRYIGQTPIKNLYIPQSKFLIGEYTGFCWEFDQYTDRTAYQIPFKFSYHIHIKS